MVRTKSNYIGYDIMNVLSDYKIHSIKSIASYIRHDKKTVVKHLNDLTVHYPINIFLGRNGGVVLDKSFTISNRYFNNEEITIIIAGLMPLKRSEKVRTIIKKLTSGKGAE